MMTIHSRSGIADRPRQLAGVKAMLGASLFHHGFSHRYVVEAARLMCAETKGAIILICDEVEIHNQLLHSRIPLPVWAEHIQASADRYEFGLRRALLKAGLAEVEIWRWRNLAYEPAYQQTVGRIRTLFQADPEFRAAVLRQMEHNIGGKIRDVEYKSGRPFSGPERSVLATYLVEEVAGLLHLAFEVGYAVDYYPGPPMPLMQNIVAGRYPELTRELPYDWSRYGWVDVRP
jgi:tRNA-dependent cyclodipeptide synthase